MSKSLIELMENAAAHAAAIPAEPNLPCVPLNVAIDIIRQHEAQELCDQVVEQHMNERMCIKGQWWIKASHEQANPRPRIDGETRKELESLATRLYERSESKAFGDSHRLRGAYYHGVVEVLLHLNFGDAVEAAKLHHLLDAKTIVGDV